MKKDHFKRSFDIIERTAKDHICIWCGKTIHKGSRCYRKPENNKMIDNLLEQATGWDIHTIKARTHFWYVDKISWPFCSSECMSNFSAYTWETLPFNVRGRMGVKIMEITNKVKDAVNLITALGGSDGKNQKALGDDN